MLSFALEASRIAHQLQTLDEIAVKIASADGSALAQNTVAKASNDLYTVIVKEAMDNSKSNIRHVPVTNFVNKLAGVLGKKTVNNDMRIKLAAAVVADDVLTDLMSQISDETKIAELRETQLYGREYFIELLRNVL
jgi:hypothetical protein